jgi:flagellar biosynthetic protein FliR
LALIETIQNTLSGWTPESIASEWLVGKALVLMMVMFRVGGMVFAAGALLSGVPLRIRASLVLLIAVVLLPNVDVGLFFTSADRRPDALAIALAAGRECVFGMIIGGTVQLLITGVQLAGELIASSTGMQLAQVADPSTGQPVPEWSRLFGMLVTALLFAAGGHRLLIDGLLASFHTASPDWTADGSSLGQFIVDQLAFGVAAGVRVAAPVVACVLLTNVMVALASRAIPQLNVLAIGMNLNLLAALAVIALTVGSAGLVFETELARSIANLGALGR